MRTWFHLHRSFLERQKRCIWWQIGKIRCTSNGRGRTRQQLDNLFVMQLPIRICFRATAEAFFIQTHQREWFIAITHIAGNCQTIFEERNSNRWNCLPVASSCLYLDHISQLDEEIHLAAYPLQQVYNEYILLM